jgi:dTDP-glucose 4,6-dehydratase
MNSNKLRALGWTPQVSWEEGIQRTVAWYKENEWWGVELRKANLRSIIKSIYKTRQSIR